MKDQTPTAEQVKRVNIPKVFTQPMQPPASKPKSQPSKPKKTEDTSTQNPNVFESNFAYTTELEEENKLAAINDILKNRDFHKTAAAINDDDDFDTFLAKLNARREAQEANIARQVS